MPKINPQTMRHYKGNPNLKCAGVQMQYTADQIAERIKCTQDPEYFIQKYLKIVHVDKGLVGFDLYPFQKDLLKAYVDNRFVIAKLPRQVGKCVHINTEVVIRYKKKYIITLSIGKLYEITKNRNFDELLNLSKTICENHEKQMLFPGMPENLRPANVSKENEAEKIGNK